MSPPMSLETVAEIISNVTKERQGFYQTFAPASHLLSGYHLTINGVKAVYSKFH